MKVMWPFIVGALIALLLYGLFPLLGLGVFGRVLSIQRCIQLFGLFVGGTGYVYYLRYILPRPQHMLFFYAIFWPVAEYANDWLMRFGGVNLHMRMLLLLVLAVPALLQMVRFGKTMLLCFPHFKYYAGFLGLLFLYYLFFNAHAMDAKLASAAVESTDNSIGMMMLTAYIFCFLGMFTSAVSIYKHPNPLGLFDTFNKTLIWVSMILGVLTIIGYPIGLFSKDVDGFHRAMGLYTHPNMFAHHMGILMIYLLGIFCYYQGERAQRMPAWLLWAGLGINLIAFLLGLSKTAIGIGSLCALGLLVFNLSSSAVRKMFLKLILAAVILVPIGLFAFEKIADRSFFDIIQSRIDQKESMNWRVETWNSLLANIRGFEYLWGHGYTAANVWVYMLSYNDTKNATPLIMVHNGYVALLYDFGLMGYIFFVSALSLMWNAMKRAAQSLFVGGRPLLVTVCMMTIYFMVVCGFDEMVYMFDGPLVYWTLATLLYAVAIQEANPWVKA